jgi:hypothetical protein
MEYPMNTTPIKHANRMAAVSAWGGIWLLGSYLTITIPVASMAWRGGDSLWYYPLVLLMAPFTIFLNDVDVIKHNLPLIIMGISLSAACVAVIGMLLGWLLYFLGWGITSMVEYWFT